MRKIINHPISITVICLLMIITLLLNPPHQTESARGDTIFLSDKVHTDDAVHINSPIADELKAEWLVNFQNLNKAFNELYQEIESERQLMGGAAEENVRVAEKGASYEEYSWEKQEAALADPYPYDSAGTTIEEQIHIYESNEEVNVPLTVEVTAYHLNVREDGHADAKILTSVEQGDILTIVRELDNGWLEMEGGRFINGKYTKYAEPEVRDESKKPEDKLVSIQSYSEAADFNDQKLVQMNNPQRKAAPKIVKTVQQNLTANKPTSVVNQASGLTSEQIEQLFEGSALSGHELGEAVLVMEEKYGINAFFTVAVMKLESGHGKSKLAKQKNNLFGLNAIDGNAYNKAFSFKTKSDSVEKFAQLISKNYVGKGLNTIEKVAKKYCPTNDKWPGLVKSIMKRDYNKLY